MAIYDPSPKLTREQRRIVSILSQLIHDTAVRQNERGNTPRYKVALSDSESAQLLELLTALLEHEEFRNKINFVESLASPQKLNIARELYLSGRGKFGRTRTLSSRQWAQFVARLGSNDPTVTWRTDTQPMTLSHFYKMEKKLFESLRVNRIAADVMLNLITLQGKDVEKLRRGQSPFKIDLIGKVFKPFIIKLENYKNGIQYLFDKKDLSAICTIVSNTSVIFTTRDWGLTGTLSTMAGAGIAALQDKK